MTRHGCRRRDRRRRPHEDRGAALLIAIGFVVMIGAITAGLASLVTSSLNNRISLQQIRDRQYAADGAIEDAIAFVRGRIDAGTAPCSSAGGSTSSTLNGNVVRVEWQPACTTLLGVEGVVVVQHDVVFAACVPTGSSCTDSPTIIRAEVNFQRTANGVVTQTFVQSWSVDR